MFVALTAHHTQILILYRQLVLLVWVYPPLNMCYFECLNDRLLKSCEGKGHPRTGIEDPEVERYSYTLSFTSALGGGWVVNTMPRSNMNQSVGTLQISEDWRLSQVT